MPHSDVTDVPVLADAPPTGALLTRVFGFGAAILFILMACFSLATPQGASPDEPAHAMRAYAAAHGQLDGPASRSAAGTIDLTVPDYFAHLEPRLACYKRVITETPACVAPLPSTDPLVTGHSSATVNTPVFYVLTGWPSLFLHDAKALYGMRLASALLCALLLGVAFAALRALPRWRWTTAALAVGVTPMVLFLSGTLNPNGLEVAATVSSFALLTLLFSRPPSRFTPLLVTGIVVIATLLIFTRSVAILWLLLALAASLLLARPAVLRAVVRRWWIVAAAVLVALVAGGAALYYLRPRALTPAYQPVGAGSSWAEGFSTTIDQTFSYLIGWIGQFGWTEAPAPALTVAVVATVGGGLLLVASGVARLRTGLALGLIGLALILVPPFSQAAVVHDAGYIWQGRYTLALAVVLLLVAGRSLDEVLPDLPWSSLGRRVLWAALCIVAIGQVAAFLWALRRYVTSLSWSTTWLDMFRHPQWQPPGGWLPVTLVFTVVALGAYAAVARHVTWPSAVVTPAAADRG